MRVNTLGARVLICSENWFSTAMMYIVATTNDGNDGNDGGKGWAGSS
jgi:hypothetical protein